MLRSVLRWFCGILIWRAALGPVDSLWAGGGERVDADGDPLPSGALVRIGTTRFRPGAVVESLAFSADGKELVTANGRSGIQVWDPATGKLLRQFGRPGPGNAPAAVSTDGR